MAENMRVLRHKLTIEQRESTQITGVLDVMSFDDGQVVAETEMGVLVLTGSGLHVAALNLDAGLLEIFGKIDSINYEEHGGQKGKKPSALGRLFK